LTGTGASVAVNWSSAEQTIDGFGAASASYTLTLPSSLMDFFYSSSGIDLNYIRLQIYPNLADCNSDLGTGACVNVASGPTIATSDLANAQAAVARGATVWASEWSPPDAMKSNDNFDAGGAFLGGAANFTALASIQASFVVWMNTAYGIPIYAISPQNEPNISQNYPSCTWTGQQFHDYIPYLQSALSAAGYGSVKIMVAEESDWGNSYSTTAMNDASVASDIAILASHAYGSSAAPLSWNNFTTQHVWETEVSDFNSYDGSITSGLTYATEISDWLSTANVNSWNYWLLSAARGFTDNEALTDVSNNIAKRAYALGNFSKFVRPGWHRVDVANTTSLLVTAFASADGTQSAVVAVNSGSSDSPQVINVGTQMGASVVPWITSSSQNLAQQSAVTISGGTLSYTIPANSIVTFVGQSSN
jgi:glucuronoarabinoxylan endo-1,4-beta-xylanase